MAIAFGTTGSTSLTAAATSATVDITAATVGNWVYCWVALGVNAGTVSATGWTSLLNADEGTSAHYALLRRQKQSGDTTFTFSWTTSTKGTLGWASWSGLDGTTPDEGAALATNGTTSRTAVPTPTATPTAATRWAVGFFGVRTTTAGNKPISWTPDAAQTERLDVDNSAAASAPWMGVEVADTNSAVTQAAHSYTATHNAAESHDGSAILFLIPAASSPQWLPNIQSRRPTVLRQPRRGSAALTAALQVADPAPIPLRCRPRPLPALARRAPRAPVDPPAAVPVQPTSRVPRTAPAMRHARSAVPLSGQPVPPVLPVRRPALWRPPRGAHIVLLLVPDALSLAGLPGARGRRPLRYPVRGHLFAPPWTAVVPTNPLWIPATRPERRPLLWAPHRTGLFAPPWPQAAPRPFRVLTLTLTGPIPKWTAGPGLPHWTAVASGPKWTIEGTDVIISVLSLEYVPVQVAAKASGALINPTADTVQMAFVGQSTSPASGDWKTASWDTDGTTYKAQCLVGPGGTVTLPVGTYSVWVKIFDNPEIPVRSPMTLQVV